MNNSSDNKKTSDESNNSSNNNDTLFRSLQLLDPILQFLTRATGQSLVSLKTLQATLPSAKLPYEHVKVLLQHDILQVAPKDYKAEEFQAQWKKATSSTFSIGFPSPDNQRLSGSTKAAAKRRFTALKQRLKQKPKKALKSKTEASTNQEEKEADKNTVPSSNKDWTLPSEDDPNHEEEPVLEAEKDARKALQDLLGLTTSRPQQDDSSSTVSSIPTCILPHQVSYGGSNPAQDADYYDDNDWKQGLDPSLIAVMMQRGGRRLYRHQADAIQSALQGIPTMVCTGTGSGKSLCFLLPVLQAALNGQRSLLLFPTKALAQDQLVKLQTWLQEQQLHSIRPATLDGDTPHSQRVDICTQSNVILTNPDTLHAAILPQWKHLYQPLLQQLQYVVLDEAHMYQGVFGAHVAMVLARLYRLTCVQPESSSPSCSRGICFLACSATLAHPEHHFRLLCCIPQATKVNIVTRDGSPRGAKHFWVWNPPFLDMNGKSLGKVKVSKQRKSCSRNKDPSATISKKRKSLSQLHDGPELSSSALEEHTHTKGSSSSRGQIGQKKFLRRRHAADETAFLLARAVSQGVRCIAFCKTRGLVEWVYERTCAALKQSPKTEKLISKVDSYRGGYSKIERRQIEDRLFQNQLLGVVGTSALELGVDIGGVDLTLHCGFPSSHASLLQQAGRAGRGVSASHRPSLAICVCFNSPIDQHLWRHPSSLLSRGLTAPLSMPIYPGLVQGHLLCAGQEFPLVGQWNVATITSASSSSSSSEPVGLLSDESLFGSKQVYQEALETLLSQGSVTEEAVAVAGNKRRRLTVYKTHPSIQNPWTQVSIRSMEPVNYDIVNIAHPKQGGRMDGIHDEAAVMDTIPYSRVFYHAFPGAIIMHRARRYKIISMTRPPAFGRAFRGTTTLGAFAKPCTDRYYTRPLSTLEITVVKQMERVDLNEASASSRATYLKQKAQDNVLHANPDAAEIYSDSILDPSAGSFGGCGVVCVKRKVHGYKKMSMVTREELSRSELSLPDMEYDTFAFWLDCDAEVVGPTMTGQDFGYGVHALSHAILAVAPMFVPCVMSDIQCDHAVFHPTRVTIFDARAGGSGICAQLWKSVFIPKGLVEAAIDLLEDCPSCSTDTGYEGGCPACLQAGECIKFNDFLCKSSGLIIAKHLLKRMKQTELYKQNAKELEQEKTAESSKISHLKDSPDVASPTRKARERALRTAKDISSARQRQIVVGRPSWPMDRSDGPRQENPE
jgi:DEAD/DEAH box helicase domain-containing protein